MKCFHWIAAMGLAAASTMGGAKADAISSLYNTGVDDSHMVLADGVADTHYAVTAVPLGVTSATAVAGRLAGTWVPDTPDAKWINPVVVPAQTPPNGTYAYTTTFSLAAGSLVASIVGQTTSDDLIVGITLNGNALTITPTPVDQGYGSWFNFSTEASYFNYGAGNVNTLVFTTANTNGVVTGLIVDMEGFQAAVPEPTSMALLGVGFAGMLAARRFRRRSA